MCLEVYALLIIARDMIIYHVNCFQKLPKRLLDSCGIDPDEEGMAAGLRLTKTGSITSCAYAVDMDALVEKQASVQPHKSRSCRNRD